MENMLFRRDNELATLRIEDKVEDGACRADVIGVREDACGTFWMGSDHRIGVLNLELNQLSLGKLFVDDAGPRPERHLAAGLPLQIGSQVTIRRKEDGFVLR